MASTTAPYAKLGDEHWDATANSLNTITDQTAQNHGQNPKEGMHRPADHETSHALLKRLWPFPGLEEMEASFHLGNYVIDRQSGQKTWEAMSLYVRVGMHLLYYGSEQEKMLQMAKTRELLKEQSVKMGREYDGPGSKAHIEPFIAAFDLQASMAEMKQPDASQYATFNDFFAREIKESARPIAEPDDDTVLSSPADCRLTAFPTIDLATKIWVKGHGFTLDKLLGSAELARVFAGGSMVIARLAPQDYHRWHSPTAGTVVSISDIPGAYYTVNPQAINEPGTLDVFCENKRSVMTLKRAATGSPVAVIAVGAMLVGSIKYNDGIAEGAEVRRGQCLGAFHYGGSTVISVYPPGEAVLDEDLVRNSTEQRCETYMHVGWRVGAGPASSTSATS